MMNMGMMEILVMLLFGSGINDLATLMDPEDYFNNRNVAMSVANMTTLATTKPVDGTTQLRQLLALRWLEANAAKVKKSGQNAAVLKQIEMVAKGQAAQDAQGFAKEYASRTAVALGSKIKVAAPRIPPGSVRKEAFSWCPKDTTFAFVNDFRSGKMHMPAEFKKARAELLAKVPVPQKAMVYMWLEKIGNVRLNRVVVSVADNNAPGQMKICVRVSGKMDRQRILQTIQAIPGNNANFAERVAPDGTKITVMSFNQQFGNPPSVLFVGDNDVVVTGYENNGNNNAALTQEILAVRSGKMPGALKGALAKDLKKISPKAIGAAVGSIPEPMRQSFMQGNGGFRVFPKNVVMEMFPKGKNVQLQARTSLDTATDAKDFVDDVDRLKKMGLAALQNVPPAPANFPNPQKLIDAARDALNSIKVEAKGKAIRGQMRVPANVASGGLMLPYLFLGTARAGAAPAPAVKQPLPVPKAKAIPNNPPPPLQQSRLDARRAFHLSMNGRWELAV